MPNQICLQCIVKLSKALSFKQQVETADSTLRHYVTQGYMNGMKLCPIIGLEFDGNDEDTVSNDILTNNYNDGNCKDLISGIETGFADENEEDFGDGNEENFVNGNEDFGDGKAENYTVGIDEHYVDENNSIENDDEPIQDQGQDLNINDEGNTEYKNSNDEIFQENSSTNVNEKQLINTENFDNNFLPNNVINEQPSIPSASSLKSEPIKEEIPLQIDNTNLDSKELIKTENKLKLKSLISEHNLTDLQRFSKRKAAQKLTENKEDAISSVLKNSELNEFGYLNPTKWMCFECKKEFSDLRKLNRHKKTHAEIKPFRCNTCNKSFIERTDLNRHLMRHYRSESDTNALNSKFKCIDCHVGFNVEKDLKIHSSIHRLDGKISCYGCNKDFLSKYFNCL